MSPDFNANDVLLVVKDIEWGPRAGDLVLFDPNQFAHPYNYIYVYSDFRHWIITPDYVEKLGPLNNPDFCTLCNKELGHYFRYVKHSDRHDFCQQLQDAYNRGLEDAVKVVAQCHLPGCVFDAIRSKKDNR